jgi:hypothetical protein
VDVSVKEMHGSANVDCVAVWFTCLNWNVTVSPIWAVMFEGLNESWPGPPTIIVWSFESAGGVEEVTVAVAAVVVAAVVVAAVVVAAVIVAAVVVAAVVVAAVVVAAVAPIAAAWNAANWLPGLIAKTMPD